MITMMYLFKMSVGIKYLISTYVVYFLSDHI